MLATVNRVYQRVIAEGFFLADSSQPIWASAMTRRKYGFALPSNRGLRRNVPWQKRLQFSGRISVRPKDSQ
jgi:hypothetical protein